MPKDVSQPDTYDVAVIGGGPAGATVSSFLARQGRRVALIEKGLHPRFHIGESLLPKNLPIIERLGLSEKLAKIGVRKPGAEFVSPDHDRRQTYFFTEAVDPEPSYAYHVRRADFDDMLFRHAASSGVSVWEGRTVTECQREVDGWRIELGGDAAVDALHARFLIDASGRDGFLARKHGLRTRNREHNSGALFAHFENVGEEAWETEGTISIFWFEHGWIWMIPLPDGITSVGAVCMPDYLKTRAGNLESFFDATLRLCPKAWAAMTNAKRVNPVSGVGNYSYRADQAHGDGYLLLGDAYTFIDPVFSTGVLLAMSSAEHAAKAVNLILDRPARAATLLRRYQKNLDRAIARISWFVYRFNLPAFKYLFMEPGDAYHVRRGVVSVLAGDVYGGLSIGWRLAMFKLIFALSSLRYRRATRERAERLSRLPAITMPENESSASGQSS